MPKSCAAINCRKRCLKGSGLSFFTFPLKDPERLQKWIVSMRRANWRPNKTTAICSAHFTKDSYQIRPDAAHPLLRSDAVPTIFDFGESEENNSVRSEPPHKKASTKAQDKLSGKMELLKLLREHDYCEKNQQKGHKRKQLLPPGNVPNVKMLIATLDCTEVDSTHECSGNTPDEILNTSEKTSDIAQSMSTVVIESPGSDVSADDAIMSAASPTKIIPVIQYTTRVLANGTELDCSPKEFKLQRSVRALQQKIRRLNNKVKSVTEQMYKMRKEKNSYEADAKLLQSRFCGMAQEIFKNQVSNGDVSKGAERYTRAMKEFALVLYGHSPAAYEYLSTIFRLPHLSCIKTYSASIKIPENLSLLDYHSANCESARVEKTYQLHIPSNAFCTIDESVCISPLTLQDDILVMNPGQSEHVT